MSVPAAAPIRTEIDVVREALGAFGFKGVPTVLAHHPGRRRVVRAGDLVVKGFAPRELAAWRREVSALRATMGAGLTPALVDAGPLWTATVWLDGFDVEGAGVDLVTVHRSLGAWLARLHLVEPVGMVRWSVVDRLRTELDAPPPTCPAPLARALRKAVEPWTAFVPDGGGAFVHGDWGTSNVVLAAPGRSDVLAAVDFEDAHVGDPAEDFRWQVLAGPASPEYTAMSSAYGVAGGALGSHAAERLAVAGAELCLGVLRWDMPSDQRGRLHERCLHTLDDLVSGRLPEPPGQIPVRQGPTDWS